MGRKALAWGAFYGVGYVIAFVANMLGPGRLSLKLAIAAGALLLGVLAWLVMTSFSVGQASVWRWLRHGDESKGP